MKLILDKKCTLIDAGPKIEQQIKQALTMKNPAYADAKKHGRWLGKIPKVLTFYEELDSGFGISFPRGFMGRALEITGRSLAFIDNRQTLPEFDFKFIGDLRPYQDQALQSVLGKSFGVLEALMGSGKTVIALAAIAARRQPTLVLVHNKELLYQWRDRIATFLGIDAGLVGDGQFTIQPVTVAIINSAKKHLDGLPAFFGQVVVDECHRTPATMFSGVVQAFDCQYMLGLSATPYRRDRLTSLIYWFVGSLSHTIDPKKLQDAGAVLIPDIHTRETEFGYQKLMDAIVKDEDRNNLIIRDVAREIREPGTILIVSDRVEHCETLAGILAGRIPGPKIEILTGQLKTKDRISLVEDIRDGKVKIVIATIQLIGEGFDCPGLSSLFLATPIKFSGRLIQVVGRILRPEDGKKPRVYDYCDPVGPLYASAKSREKTYREMGWIEAKIDKQPPLL